MISWLIAQVICSVGIIAKKLAFNGLNAVSLTPNLRRLILTETTR